MKAFQPIKWSAVISNSKKPAAVHMESTRKSRNRCHVRPSPRVPTTTLTWPPTLTPYSLPGDVSSCSGTLGFAPPIFKRSCSLVQKDPDFGRSLEFGLSVFVFFSREDHSILKNNYARNTFEQKFRCTRISTTRSLNLHHTRNGMHLLFWIITRLNQTDNYFLIKIFLKF
jgi:hypothetical protein